MGRSKPATLAQAVRFDALFSLGCIACWIKRRKWVAPEMDHRNTGDLAGMKRTAGGHDDTIPLCCWHHRAIPFEGWTEPATREWAGPSKHGQKRAFLAEFGSIQHLADLTAAALERGRW